MDKNLLYNIHKIDSISDSDALDLIAECILGPDWHVVDSMTKEQSNVFLVREIIERYDEINHTYIKQNWNKFIDKLKIKVR